MSSKLKIDPVAWSEYIFYKKATLKVRIWVSIAGCSIAPFTRTSNPD